jgi:2-polyprenyl-3-methyl-5-hydroxy-6-metoxy-1,4-benzoquinol methylase
MYDHIYSKASDISVWVQRKLIRTRKHESDYALNFIEDGMKVLDYGCNTGWIASLVKEEYPNCSVSGFDINSYAIETAQERHDNITFTDKLDDLEKYDVIIVSHVVEHIPDPYKAIDNISNFLKNRGRLIVMVPQENIKGITTFFQIMINALRFKIKNPHLHKIDYSMCRKIMKNSGLEPVEYTYVNYLPYFYSKNIGLTYSLVMVAQK